MHGIARAGTGFQGESIAHETAVTAAEVRHLLAPGAALPGALSATATSQPFTSQGSASVSIRLQIALNAESLSGSPPAVPE
jgi:hypothetical protein